MAGQPQGGQGGTPSTMSIADLLQQQGQQQKYNALGNAVSQGFQKAAGSVGAPVGATTVAQPVGVSGQAQPQAGANYGPTGPLFQAGGGGGGGINEQQLAQILQQLGYGGGGSIQ